MAYIRLTDRSISVLETIAEIFDMCKTQKFLCLTEHTTTYGEFSSKEQVYDTPIVINSDHIVSIQ